MEPKDNRNQKTPDGSSRNKKVALVLVAVCILVAALALLLLQLRGKEEPGSSSSAPPSISLPPPPPSSLPAPSSSTPEPEPEPEPPGPVFHFTDEEVDTLDALLRGWAAERPVLDEETAASLEDHYGRNVAVYFLDLDSGAEYIYNGGHKFMIASLNKAPYAMYLYTLAEQGACSLDELFYVTHESIAGSLENSGRIKDDPDLPRNYTMDELIYYMLRYSDTAALRILLGRYGADGYAEYAAGLGLHHPEDVRDLINSRITAPDCGVYLSALYNYMETGAYGEELREHMMNTRNHMIRTQHPAARKYGWDKTALHEMAVVYGEHPYLLAILTDKSYGTPAEQGKFGAITRLLEEMMEQKYSGL